MKYALLGLALLIFPSSLFALESTSADRKNLELTVYNDNFALVKEVRQVSLQAGAQAIQYSDVSRYITPETIQVRSLNAPSELNILEQNYQGQTLNSQALLDRYVGKKIKLLNWNEFQDRKDVVDATLLSNDGETVYQIGGSVYIGYPGSKILPELPGDMLAKPAFIWKVENKTAKPHELEVVYLTSNLSWKADYVLNLPEAGNQGELGAWVSLTNNSGTAFKNAGLRLMAGQVNRQRPEIYAPKAMMMRAASADMAGGSSFQEQGVFEYHAYDLNRRADLENAETKQLQLFQPRPIKFNKEYRVESSPYYYSSFQTQEKHKLPVQVFIKFKNDKVSGAGLPLPQGTVRFYTRDAKGRTGYLGEDSIRHTPEGEEVSLKAGEAFDLTAERKQTDFKQVTSNTSESEWEIKFTNRKQEDVVIQLFENLQGSWEVTAKSENFEKISASSIKFNVKVPKNTEVTIKYRIKTGF